MEAPPPPAELVSFLEALFLPDDLVVLRPIESWSDGAKKRSRTVYDAIRYFYRKDLIHPQTWATITRRLAKERAHGFFGVCPRLSGRHDLAWQIRTIRVLWADLDHCSPEEALRRCAAAGLPPPSIVVSSGHGCHLYWLLTAPVVLEDAGEPPPVNKEFRTQPDGKKVPIRWFQDPVGGDRVYEFLDDARKKKNPLWPAVSGQGQHFQHILAGLARQIGGDHTQDLARLLRLPGTLNRKDERNGQVPVPCTLVSCEPTRRYALADFERCATAAPEYAAAQAAATVRLKSGVRLTVPRRNKLADFLNDCAVATDRSLADFALCCWAVETGLDRDAVWAECQAVGKFAERGLDYFTLTWTKAEQKARHRAYRRACRRQLPDVTADARRAIPCRRPAVAGHPGQPSPVARRDRRRLARRVGPQRPADGAAAGRRVDALARRRQHRRAASGAVD